MSDKKKAVSTDTNVETKVVPVGNDSVKKITTTTTKTTYADGSTSTKIATETVTETVRRVTAETKTHTQTVTEKQGHAHHHVTEKQGHGHHHQPHVTEKKGHGHHKHHGTSGPRSGSKSSSSSSDSDSDNEDFTEFQQQALKSHNAYRKKHGAPPLKLNKKMCQASQNWAKTIASKGKLEHSQGTGYGENVFWTSGEVGNGSIPVDNWYNEVKAYKYGSANYQAGTENAEKTTLIPREETLPVFLYVFDLFSFHLSSHTPLHGHFTQVVWKDSTQLGIGKASGGSGGTFVVANYNPAGNFQGQFNQNVSPPK